MNGDRLVIQARPWPKYVLEDLLTQYDLTAEPSAEDNELIGAQPVGGELF